jgi:hypothetical protein
MSERCVSGKRMFLTQQLAEDALIDLWSKHEYVMGQAPITVYKCEDCGQYHFTSKGIINQRLADEVASGKIKLQREASKWLDKFKKQKW